MSFIIRKIGGETPEYANKTGKGYTEDISEARHYPTRNDAVSELICGDWEEVVEVDE